VDLMVWSRREGHILGIRLFCAPALGDQNYMMYKTKGWGWLLIPDSVELIWKPISLFCEFILDSWKVPRSPILIPWSCGSHGLISTIRGSTWREGQSWAIRMFWSPELEDQTVAQATFDPMILWI
jgi:hypothetical protein